MAATSSVLLVAACFALGSTVASTPPDISSLKSPLAAFLTPEGPSGIDIDEFVGTWTTYYGPRGVYMKTFVQLSKTTTKEITAYQQRILLSDLRPTTDYDWGKISLYGRISADWGNREFLVEVIEKRNIRIIPIDARLAIDTNVFDVDFNGGKMVLRNCSYGLEIDLFRIESVEKEVKLCAFQAMDTTTRYYSEKMPAGNSDEPRKSIEIKKTELVNDTTISEEDWYKVSLHVENRTQGITYKKHVSTEVVGKSGTILPATLQSSLDALGIYLSSTAHEENIDIATVREDLYNNITEASYGNAVTLSKMLDSSSNGHIIAEIVKRLLNGGVRNTMGYAYKLWNDDAKDILTKYFPESFKLIFNEDYVRIINKRYQAPLKLDSSVDDYTNNGRLVWGDSGKAGCDSSSFKWKIIPIWNDNEIYFSIMNVKYDMYIKLDENLDTFDERIAWGDKDVGLSRFRWYLEPVKVNDDIVFYLINRAYNQGLKLHWQEDVIGDRRLWGHDGYIYADRGFALVWSIKPWM